jgi:cysteinyl-tRNA synthetase
MGFPGWHIECSAMIRATLGEQVDIHTGGIEHVPIHHNNEIAQSECATGKSPFARIWMHRAHIQKDEGKLAKSTGNVAYLTDVIDNGYHASALRYWFLTSHYRANANFTLEALKGAQQALARLVHFVHENKSASASVPSRYATLLKEHFNNDLDTPGAIALVWESQKDSALSDAEKRAVILEADTVLGLSIAKPDASLLSFVQQEFGLTVSPDTAPAEIQTLLDARALARTNKNWTESDRIRDELSAQGYAVKDTTEGQILSRT